MTEQITVAIGQFSVSKQFSDNLDTIDQYAHDADEHSASILLLPEGLIARDPRDPSYTVAHAQPIDGPFVTGLLDISRHVNVTIVGTVHMPPSHNDSDPRARNQLLVLRHGKMLASYQKLHLYDAFGARESDTVAPGASLPPVLDIDGWKVGFMTCYDVRFPELARALALRGAEILAVSAAWVRGPLKERHWALSTAARALDNTCYVMACSESSLRNIGCSRVIDPLGETIASLGTADGILYAVLRRDVIASARQTLPVLVNRRFDPPVLSTEQPGNVPNLSNEHSYNQKEKEQ